jgi:Domain of unknown function (DUF4262)
MKSPLDGLRFPKNRPIPEYVGQRITHSEAMNRMNGPDCKRISELAADCYIEGRIEENDTQYINHSCEPNADAVTGKALSRLPFAASQRFPVYWKLIDGLPTGSIKQSIVSRHVMKVLETPATPGWAYSVGLYRSFGHAEILVFGQDPDLMHFMINTIGEGVQAGKSFAVDETYGDLIDAYRCTLKPVRLKWYAAFMGFASWFYEGDDYPVLQCFWPDFENHYPWDFNFDPQLTWAQPLLFHEEPITARVQGLIESLDLEVTD